MRCGLSCMPAGWTPARRSGCQFLQSVVLQYIMACTSHVCHIIARAACRIEPADANFNLASPDKYNGSYGGLPRMADYIARARTEAAAAQQDILVLHAGEMRCTAAGGPAGW